MHNRPTEKIQQLFSYPTHYTLSLYSSSYECVLRVVKSGEGDDGHAKETKQNVGGGGY